MDLWKKLWRTKSLEQLTSETCLNRCLSIFDLVIIGIGGMVGSGIYIMTGITAKEQSGPSILISFVITMVVVMLIAACFTELAARLHKTGSTYLYLYLTVGELPAFVVGFGILLCGILGGATNARAWSSYVDFLFHGMISNYTEEYLAKWNIGPPVASYPDLMAVAITILLTVVVALGVQCSAKFSAIFVVINLCLLLFITICGFVYGHITNWIHIPLNNETTADAYDSFFPFGWSGTLQGSAACFWAFSGFEMISCAVEETRNPKRNIPAAMAIAILLVTLLYLGTAAGLTLLVPYTLIDSTAPLPSAFLYAGLTWGHYITSIGPLCGFTTTLISNTYGFVRVALAMAEDGLLFRWFATVNSWTHAPVWPVILCGVLQSIIAFAFDIRDLIAFNVNLLLLSYGSVCACVIVLRYQRTANEHDEDDSVDSSTETQRLISNDEECDPSPPDTCSIDKIHTTDDEDGVIQPPNRLIASCRCMEPLAVMMQGQSITVSLVVMFFSMLGLAVVFINFFLSLELGVWWTVVVVTIASAGVVLSFGFICIHRQTLHHSALQIPCVPLVPSAAVFACLVLLVVNSTLVGWIGFAAVIFSALIIYFSYALRNSHLNAVSANSTCRSVQRPTLKVSCEDDPTKHLLYCDDDTEDDAV